MIVDLIFHEAIKDCEDAIQVEQIGRRDSWPSAAAVAYWQNIFTLRRILTAPHCL